MNKSFNGIWARGGVRPSNIFLPRSQRFSPLRIDRTLETIEREDPSDFHKPVAGSAWHRVLYGPQYGVRWQSAAATPLSASSKCEMLSCRFLAKDVFGYNLCSVKAVEVMVGADGTLKLPIGISLPSDARVAVLVLDKDDSSGRLIAGLAEASGAFDFLKEEPDIYSDEDILPGRQNPGFRK
jgi:hypothetical protein